MVGQGVSQGVERDVKGEDQRSSDENKNKKISLPHASTHAYSLCLDHDMRFHEGTYDCTTTAQCQVDRWLVVAYLASGGDS